MRKFIALDKDGNPTAFIPGVPARDLTDEEWEEHAEAGRIVEGEPSAALWEPNKKAAKVAEKGE